jgi:hypothetical protein
MPRGVAAIALVSGAAVVAFGVLFRALAPSETPDAVMPRATLEPVDDVATPTGEGVVGRVVQKDGDPVADADVTLVPLFMEKGIDPIETTTDEDGRFAFDDVHVDPGSPWVAEASFDDERFPSDVLRAPRTKEHPLKLVVANTTKDPRDIEVRVESLAVVGDATGAQAVHALTISNHGTRAYTGGLRLPLLKGATAIQEGAGLDRRWLDLEDGGMTSTAPLLPGTHDLTYTYVLQQTRTGIALDHRTTLPTDRYELLTGRGLALEGSGELRDDGEVELGPRTEQRTYHRFVARNLGAGDRIRARIVVARPSNALRVAVPIAAGVLALVVFLLPLLLRRRRSEPSAPAPEPSSTAA